MDISKADIKILASQRMDDTDQGGGQMTVTEIVSGQVNAMFPDISRLDRAYGRVFLRKVFGAIQTTDRPTYYGSHAIITRNAVDPNVSVCFFSSEDWFDTRLSAKQRIESYLVRGPFFPSALWGNHYRGVSQLQLHTHKDQTPPEIGDVLVLVWHQGLNDEQYQYVRVTKVVTENRVFVWNGSTEYTKRLMTIDIGNILEYDFIGEEIFWEGSGGNYGAAGQDTLIYTTVAADASRYYGVASLKEDAIAGSYLIRVDDINVPIVPSATSTDAITDAGVGQAVSMMLQTNATVSVTRSISYSISNSSKLYLGEGVLPGSFNWVGGLPITDDSKGNLFSNGTIVGSIMYENGICTFNGITGTLNGTGSATYIPACSPTEISNTGAILIDINNRNFNYIFSCTPLPKKGTVRIFFLAAGKWYSIWDQGNGSLAGSDPSVGSGSVNVVSGSIGMTLGAMPDVGSMVLIFWGKDSTYFDLSGETLSPVYEFQTHNTGIAKNSFELSWNNNAAAVVDDGSGNLTMGVWSVDHWNSSATIVGVLHYASGIGKFTPHSSQVVPATIDDFHFVYTYGDKHSESFNPGRYPDGSLTFYLTNLPVTPGTMTVTWHTDQEEYDATSGIRRHIDPTWSFQDNSIGGLKNENGGGLPGYFPTTVNYTNGQIHMMPDRKGSFPASNFIWRNTGLFDPEHRPLKEYVFHSLSYLPAASIWPTDGVIVVDYCSASGSTVDDYSEPIPKKFFIKPDSNLESIPGSIKFTAVVGATTHYLADVGNGKLYRDIIGTTGIGTECGTVNYMERSFIITDPVLTNRTAVVKSCCGTAAIDPVNMMVFKTPASPIVPGLFTIKATTGTGTIIEGTADFNGLISGVGVTGKIEFSTGIGMVSFGAWFEDIWAAMPVEDRPSWYASAPLDNGNVWKPYSVRASTVLINSVIMSTIPLSADLIGLDPVRLPMDGKVPIFRDGYLILVHHTLRENLPNPIVGGVTYQLSREDVDAIELYDSTGKYYPEIDNDVNYTVDLEDGSVTIANTFNLSGFIQPFYAVHRIEDIALASDVQITGYIAITPSLTHNYPKDDTMVSSVLPSKDLQARCYNEFVQTSWNNIWSNSLQGTEPLANYDFVNFPITVYNKGATKERWLLKWTTTAYFDVIGENLGVLLSGVAADGSTPKASGTTSGWSPDGSILYIKNRLTGESYWSMQRLGLGAGWAAGNCIRWNTDAANYPYWFIRTVLQARATEPTDNYEFQLRGDNA